jgi:hypothetical protein
LKPATEKMEVHHHSSHHKKNWKEYVSEFIMLFLAVFAGFIAENIREHYTDRGKEKEYIASMISDMKMDTAQINAIVKANNKLLKGIDSLLVFTSGKVDTVVIKKIYKYYPYVSGSILFESTEGTLTQLKNAGGFRLIKDTASVHRIMEYDYLNQIIKKQGDAYYSQNIELIHLMEEMIDLSVINNPSKTNYYFNQSPDKLRLLYNKCFYQKQIIAGYCSLLQFQSGNAVKYMNVLSKNYNIKE